MVLPQSMGQVISIKNLVKRYEDVTAVNDLSFSVEAGEVFGARAQAFSTERARARETIKTLKLEVN